MTRPAMLFKIDEKLPRDAADLIQENGHDAETVFDEKLQGTPDQKIAEVCREESRILVTLDTDFGNIKAFPPTEYPGLIVIRSKDQSKPVVLQLIKSFLTALEKESVENKLWVVEPNRLRIRSKE